MAVSSPGRKLQLTRLTAKCPPKRMVRSRVSRVVIEPSSGCLVKSQALSTYSVVMRGLDPRIHPLPKKALSGSRMDCRVKPGNDEIATPKARGTVTSALVADRDVHVLDLEFANRFVHRPGEVRVDLDPEVIHALQRLMVLLAEDHLALRRIELHAFHRGDQLLGVGRFRLGDGS